MGENIKRLTPYPTLNISNAGSRSDQQLNDTGVQPPVDLPANTRGVPTPEALVAVLRHAERLFSGHAISALSVCTAI